jgi:hypothetical protein
VPVVQHLCPVCQRAWATLVISRPAPWLDLDVGPGFREYAQVCSREFPPAFARMTGRQQQVAIATIWELIDQSRGRLGVNKWLPTVRRKLVEGRESRVEGATASPQPPTTGPQPLGPRESFARVLFGRVWQAVRRQWTQRVAAPAPAVVFTPEDRP